MNTPICDFVRRYAASNTLRAHMPGHKGVLNLGAEPYDITEIAGADSLYECSGIIRESEQNASTLFGAPTFYSTEGSSQCIRAMLYLAVLHAKRQGKKPCIAAARNVHKAFVSAAALLDFDVQWLHTHQTESYLSCTLDAMQLERQLAAASEPPTAVYVTSPDYLGNCLPLRDLAEVCHQYGVLLLVDNAHGAYLKFLPSSLHPLDLGADMCCDSAHKTLPVLTGGAYLHIAPTASPWFAEQAKTALSLFGSTSPSYVILQSLDAANRYLAEGYPARLAVFVQAVDAMKGRLKTHGFTLCGDESLKITLHAPSYGYRGKQLAERLETAGVMCEFADTDFVVCMLTPELGTDGLQKLESALSNVPRCAAVLTNPPTWQLPPRVLSIRDAVLLASEIVPVERSVGRVLATTTVGCPPAVPIAVAGERITPSVAAAFTYYGFKECTVVMDGE